VINIGAAIHKGILAAIVLARIPGLIGRRQPPQQSAHRNLHDQPMALLEQI
jgi:hypothetical protein